MEDIIKANKCANCGTELTNKHPKATINDHPVCLACVRLLNEGVEWGIFIDELDRLANWEEPVDYEVDGYDVEEFEEWEQWEEEYAQDEN